MILESAIFLNKKGIKLIGIDYLSIESFHLNEDVHRELLSKNMTIIDSIDLNNVNEGEFELNMSSFKNCSKRWLTCESYIKKN